LGSARELAEANPASSMLARRMAELCRKTADVYERQSEYEIAHEWLELGLQRLDQTAPTIEAVRILLLKAGVHYRQGKFEETITLGGEILLRASRIQSREAKQAVAQTYYLMGGTNIRLGDLEQAAELSGKSVRAYQEIDHIVGQAKAYNNLGNAYTSLGKLDLASEALEKSLGIFQKIGDIQEQGFVTNNLGNIYLNRGEWDQAANLFQQSNRVWKQIGAALPDAVSLSNLAQVHIYREDAPAAHECLRASQEIFTNVGSDAFVPELERRFGEYHLLCGEMDDAFHHVNRSIDHAKEQDARLEIGMSLRLLGEIHILRGDLDSGKDALLESLRTLNELKSEYEAAKTVLALGQLALEGEVAIDRTQIDQAIATLERLGAKADLVRGRELTQLMSDAGM
jgi:tetratricopeptide (TPR) repeat protein